MDEKTLQQRSKRGKRRNKIDVPQRFLDHLNTNGLENTELPTSQTVDTRTPKVITLDDLFNRYYVAREAAGAAPRTLEDYVKHMRWLHRFMASEYNGLETVLPNREVIRAWISHMITVQKLKPSTINIRLRTVKAMFNWAVKEGILRETPFENVQLLRVPQDDFQILNKSQEKKLFQQCDLQTFAGIRDALLVSFLLDTGVRIGECMRTLLDDVDLVKRSVLIRAASAKTRKARTVYFVFANIKVDHVGVP